MDLLSEDILFLLLLFSEQQSMVPGKGAVKGSMLQQIAGFLNSILALTGGCISFLTINSPNDRNIHSGLGFNYGSVRIEKGTDSPGMKNLTE